MTKEKDQMTCQCCGRAIFAKLGTIAHHGYQRPEGWHAQTASCMGAKHLPFEVSRDRLGDLIANVSDRIERMQKYLADVQAEAVAIPFAYSDRPRGFGSKRVERSVDVTRETFADVRPAYEVEMG